MKHIHNITLSRWFLSVLGVLAAGNVFGQSAAAAPAATGGSFSYPVNTILCCVALVLLFIIILLAATLNGAIELYKHKRAANKSSGAAGAALLIGLLLLSQAAFSQTAGAAANTASSTASADMAAKWYFYGFIIVIIVEIAIILFFIRALRFLTGIDQFSKKMAAEGKEATLWTKLNQFRPLEEEATLDTGHDYDGIHELDNITPPWFTVGFLATIIFAIVYLYRFNISHTQPNQIQEFEAQMSAAKALQDSMLKLEGNKVDENTVVMLGQADIDAGHKIFSGNCAPCHGDKGQGIVGPNLTDDYWIHGGSIHDVFKSIKYGWVEKGMKSWKDDFSPNQIAQLASFIKSLKGSNPPGAKEKQGELYVEKAEAPVAAADSAKASGKDQSK